MLAHLGVRSGKVASHMLSADILSNRVSARPLIRSSLPWEETAKKDAEGTSVSKEDKPAKRSRSPSTDQEEESKRATSFRKHMC